jgi:hypothetical protein
MTSGVLMRFTITHHGVPIGTVELDASADRALGPVATLPAYAVVRALVQAATEALSGVTAGPGDRAAAERGTVFGRAASLGRALEVRDERGESVATDYVELHDRPGAEPEVAAAVGFRGAPAHVPARGTPGRRDARDVS